MRRCIGCQPQGWKSFIFNRYQHHISGVGYATPEVCLSAAYAWSRVVKREYKRHRQLKMKHFKLPSNWQGNGVCIVMHDGSTTTLGTMLRLYLPNTEVKRYNKRCNNEKSAAPLKRHFIVMCEDGISQGRSLCKMRKFVKRPIDLLLTIGGYSIDTLRKNNLALIHHQLNKG